MALKLSISGGSGLQVMLASIEPVINLLRFLGMDLHRDLRGGLPACGRQSMFFTTTALMAAIIEFGSIATRRMSLNVFAPETTGRPRCSHAHKPEQMRYKLPQ